ncbi:fibropellin-3-like isoform X2 [Rhopilema esculentum]|uniref:fibropellin-3-like isoform X2 n=1 Tax=Rhopilema esculentum TaxID=499914 RepID=UPI0031DBA0C9
MSIPHKEIFLCLALPVLMFGVDGLILRLPCQTEAYFTVTMAWRYLQDALLLSLPNATVPECTKSCVQHPKCKSINMKSDNTGCELNSKHHDMLGISMITTAGWTYVSTDYQSLKIGLTCRSASFCPPNVLCRDTCDPPYYECVQCDAFHEGLHCDRRKDFDECLHSPCQNNGSCTDLTKDYLCNCTPGYTGKSCETEINECLSYPCLNHGHCIDLVNGYSCICLPGTTGNHCETNIDDCASGPCQNGGTCNDGLNKYNCTCAGGFSGKHCEQDIDECASSPCLNGGDCTNLINQYTCTCGTNYRGTNCGRLKREEEED